MPHSEHRDILSSKTTVAPSLILPGSRSFSNCKQCSGQDLSQMRAGVTQDRVEIQADRVSSSLNFNMVNAFVGQSIAQRPHPVHFSLLRIGKPSFLDRIPFKNSRRLILFLNREEFKFSLSLQEWMFVRFFHSPAITPNISALKGRIIPSGQRFQWT